MMAMLLTFLWPRDKSERCKFVKFSDFWYVVFLYFTLGRKFTSDLSFFPTAYTGILSVFYTQYVLPVLYPTLCFIPKRHELLVRADSKMCACLNMLGKSEAAPVEGVSEARADDGTPEYHGVSRTQVMQMSTGMSCGA